MQLKPDLQSLKRRQASPGTQLEAWATPIAVPAHANSISQR
jgi:hypothetical protein